MTSFAAIDVGSNAMRCLVARAGADGEPQILESAREPVRLGSSVFHTGRIGEALIGRTVEAFRLFRRLIEATDVEHVRAIATSAVREAADADELLERVLGETGISIKVIDGAEEAHLVRRAVGRRLDVTAGYCAAVDLGGGSVELLVMRDGDVVRAESFTIGAVRLLEALAGGQEEGASEFFSLLSEYVDAIGARVRTAVGTEPVDLVAATGGSIESLADLAGEPAEGERILVGGVRTIRLDRLRRLTVKLARRSYRERVERYDLREDRADVILPAAVVYLKIAELLQAECLHVPGVGLKDGLVLDMIDDLERRGAIEHRRREIRAAALGLGRRYAIDEPHVVKVTELALSLFDQLRALHGLGAEARTLLEAAALLHEVGLFISAARHHKHSYYIVSESELVGLDRREREIVANITRYHRKSHPTRKHPHFDALLPADRELVRRLAAILRAADVLDREHSQHVHGVKVVERGGVLDLAVESEGDLLLEKWASDRKFGLFEEVFGKRLRIRNGKEVG
jgi:exopolyphosphatase/guanosine-5'-triphosphate,3'-diphosphate pyrophosphatase